MTAQKEPELKPVEYHLLKCPIGRGELCIYAPKDLDEFDFKLVQKFFKLRYYKKADSIIQSLPNLLEVSNEQ